MTQVEPSAYRSAIASFATGVTIVTTMHEGAPVGMTASAVASLSLDPVLLLVCVDNRMSTHRALDASRRFAVNVLHEGQEALAHRFATKGVDRFAGLELRDDRDLPVLADSLAHFICEVHERFPGGDHSIFTGMVQECEANRDGRPLLYFRSSYGILEPPTDLLAYSGGLGIH
jgi:flavin reductase (DIM6/NTAB) family NADH-FMN oxidoreductase RutF